MGVLRDGDPDVGEPMRAFARGGSIESDLQGGARTDELHRALEVALEIDDRVVALRAQRFEVARQSRHRAQRALHALAGERDDVADPLDEAQHAGESILDQPVDFDVRLMPAQGDEGRQRDDDVAERGQADEENAACHVDVLPTERP